MDNEHVKVVGPDEDASVYYILANKKINFKDIKVIATE
jgi:hypothetical protein